MNNAKGPDAVLDKFECIKRMSLFSDLGSVEFEEILSLIEKRAYARDDFLCMEGDPADKIFVLKSGRVKLCKNSEDGKELILGFLRANDIFGEDSVFTGETYSVSAVALEETCVATFTKAAVEKLFMRKPAIAVKVIKGLSKRLAHSTSQVTDLAFRDARGRLVSALLRLASDYGVKTEEGLAIGLSLTHQDLASVVGLSRTTVTNLLLLLRCEGLIRIAGRRIVLTDRERLEELAG